MREKRHEMAAFFFIGQTSDGNGGLHNVNGNQSVKMSKPVRVCFLSFGKKVGCLKKSCSECQQIQKNALHLRFATFVLYD